MKFRLIVPSSNTTMEAEFWRMAFGWAMVYTTRTRLQKVTIDDLEEMEEQTLESAILLAEAEVDVIGYGCTSGSLFRCKDHGRNIEREITEKTGISAVAKAAIEALGKLHISSVCVATPYTEKINKIEKSYLEQNEIDDLRIKGVSIVHKREFGNKHPSIAYELAKELHVPENQGST